LQKPKNQPKMKNLLLIFTVFIAITACKTDKKETVKTPETIIKYASFGDKISAENAISKNEMLQKFKSLKKGDTIQVKFKTKINKSCKKKGCWMRLDLGNNEESLVRFKDYGFFVPLNSAGKDVVVNGKAYLDVVTVAQLQHYAKDEGLSQEEINKITEDEVTYAIESDGVLLVE
jgi:CRISPR/Cas system CMR-associated protein Cmr3 (group 5 of RAMP superfamily)